MSRKLELEAASDLCEEKGLDEAAKVLRVLAESPYGDSGNLEIVLQVWLPWVAERTSEMLSDITERLSAAVTGPPVGAIDADFVAEAMRSRSRTRERTRQLAARHVADSEKSPGTELSK